jgi:putative oxidoreductase
MNGRWPTAQSIAMLASTMQQGGTKQSEAIQGVTRMIANDTATRITGNTPTLGRGRVAIVVLWVAQVALAVMFLMAGGSKLAGVPAMVSLFDALGLGQWFRYVTGVIEVASGIALLVPSAALFGAMLLIPTMLGAVAANLFLGQSPVAPLALLLVAAAVAWTRRNQLQGLFSR